MPDTRHVTTAAPRSKSGGHVGSSLTATLLVLAALVALAVAPTAIPDSYSWVEHGISESGAQGVEGAWVTRFGFILYGLGVLAIVRIRARSWGVAGAVCHTAFGVSMFAVAAFAAKPWEEDRPYIESEDVLHSIFAGVIGFGFVVGVLAVMIARQLPSIRAAVPDLVALVVTISVPMTMSTSVWGLLQRLMFLTAAAWYVREAWMPSAEAISVGTDVALHSADG